MKQQHLKKFNCTLTDWVISLHQKGYTNDFAAVNKESVQCVQNGERFSIRELRICLVHCGYDLLTRTYQYIHTIDTEIGYKGLLIINGILPLNSQAFN